MSYFKVKFGREERTLCLTMVKTKRHKAVEFSFTFYNSSFSLFHLVYHHIVLTVHTVNKQTIIGFEGNIDLYGKFNFIENYVITCGPPTFSDFLSIASLLSFSFASLTLCLFFE